MNPPTNTVLPIAGLDRRSIVSARFWLGILGMIVMASLLIHDFTLFASVFLTCHIIAGFIAISFLESHFNQTPPKAANIVSFTILVLGYIGLAVIAFQPLKKYPEKF